VKHLLLPFGAVIFFLGIIGFSLHMQYREENTRSVCVEPPFLAGICGDVVAAPGERILLDDIVGLPENGPVVHNYWVRINGKYVAVDVEDDGHNGVDLYAIVPGPEPFFFGGRSPLSPAQKLFQECINVGGQLYGLDKDGDGYMVGIDETTGDVNSYPCVVSGSLLGDYYMTVFLMNVDRIGADRDDSDNSFH
jgi:hypothetical protein